MISTRRLTNRLIADSASEIADATTQSGRRHTLASVGTQHCSNTSTILIATKKVILLGIELRQQRHCRSNVPFVIDSTFIGGAASAADDARLVATGALLARISRTIVGIVTIGIALTIARRSLTDATHNTTYTNEQ
jgi:hypothetical protein